MMKISELPLVAFIIKWTIAAIVLIVIILILQREYGYVIVMLEPQYAHLQKDGDVEIKELMINEKNIPVKAAVATLSLRDPISMLKGSRELLLELEIDERNGMWLFFNIERNNIQLANIAYFPNEDHFGGDWYNGGSSTCLTSDGENVEVFRGYFNDVNAEVRISKIEQLFKHFSISGNLSVSKSSLPFHPKDICEKLSTDSKRGINIDALNISFAIDSPVIYEWSNKAGKTWRL